MHYPLMTREIETAMLPMMDFTSLQGAGGLSDRRFS